MTQWDTIPSWTGTRRKCLDCPTLITKGSRCDTCQRAKNRAINARKNSRTNPVTGGKLYGAEHKKARAAMKAHVEAGGKPLCPRCNYMVHPFQPFDLDHVWQADGTWTYGASHTSCNRGAKRK